jgi:deazaflavin-dependent oxidoreductase (nitroreductase family)
MRKVVGTVAGGLLVVGSAIGVVFVVGMRRRSPTVINSVRRLSRATKQYPMKSAGRPHAYASVVRHVGRTSGREYETPVRAVPTADGFVVALPYGSASDWVRNVRAHGTAVIVHDGTEYRVDQPRVVPLAGVEDSFPPGEQRAHRLFGVAECLTLHRVTADQQVPASAE